MQAQYSNLNAHPLFPKKLEEPIPELAEENQSELNSSQQHGSLLAGSRPLLNKSAHSPSPERDSNRVVEQHLQITEDSEDEVPAQESESTYTNPGGGYSKRASSPLAGRSTAPPYGGAYEASLSQRGRQLLTLTVDLGEEGAENILIYENDQPQQIATQFCQKHRIDDRLKQLLIAHIKQNMEQVRGELMQLYQPGEGGSNKSVQEGLIDGFSTPSTHRFLNQYQNPAYSCREIHPIPEAYNSGQTGSSHNTKIERGNVENQYSFMDSSSVPRAESVKISRKLNESLYKRRESLSERKNEENQGYGRLNGTLSSQADYFEHLYQKGLKKKEEKERIWREELREKEEREIRGLSFRPQIAKTSRMYIRYTENRTEEELFEKQQKLQNRLEQKRIEKSINETRECVFKPKINEKSSWMAEQRDRKLAEDVSLSYPNKFERLYNEAKRKQNKQEERKRGTPRGCTFTPNISDFSRRKAEMLPSSVEERLQRTVDYERLQSKYQKNVDPKTGQEYFRPKINKRRMEEHRSPGGMERVGGGEIEADGDSFGARLYERARTQQESLRMKAETEKEQAKEKCNKKHVSSFSAKIMETKKKRKFRQIFALLDSDNDGAINAQKVCISGLQPGVLELLSPLLCAMEDQDKTYDLQSFYVAADELYLSLPPPDKIRFLDEEKKKKKYDDTPNFQPELNQKSLKMAARNEQRGKNVADRLIQSKLRTTRKIEERKEETKDDELKDCTFKPSIRKDTPKSLRKKRLEQKLNL